MIDYNPIIKAKYPAARAMFEEGQNYEVSAQWDEELQDLVPFFSMWNLPDPQPTFAELDEYATSPEYLAILAAILKTSYTALVNEWANNKVMEMHILEPQLAYVAMVANIAFRLLEWRTEGRPSVPDPGRYIITYAEAAAYRRAHTGKGDFEETITEAQLLSIQEARWLQMQAGWAFIRGTSRYALEKIKLAQPGEGLEAELVTVLAGLEGN